MPSDLSRSQAIPSARQACEVGLLFSPFHGRGRYVTNPIFEVRRRWQAPSVNGDCCWRWPGPWYLAGRKWHREGGDEGPRGLGGAALAGGVKEQSGGHPQ